MVLFSSGCAWSCYSRFLNHVLYSMDFSVISLTSKILNINKNLETQTSLIWKFFAIGFGVLGVDRSYSYKALTSLIEFPQSQKFQYISPTHFLDPGSQGTGTIHATTRYELNSKCKYQDNATIFYSVKSYMARAISKLSLENYLNNTYIWYVECTL